MAYNQRTLRPFGFQVRILRDFETPYGIFIGKGSVLYYPKQVVDMLISYGWAERTYATASQIQ